MNWSSTLAAALRSVSRTSRAATSCSGSSAWLSSSSRRRSSNAAVRNVIRTTRSGRRVAEVIEPASWSTTSRRRWAAPSTNDASTCDASTCDPSTSGAAAAARGAAGGVGGAGSGPGSGAASATAAAVAARDGAAERCGGAERFGGAGGAVPAARRRAGWPGGSGVPPGSMTRGSVGWSVTSNSANWVWSTRPVARRRRDRPRPCSPARTPTGCAGCWAARVRPRCGPAADTPL